MRVKRGVIRRAKHKKIIKKAKGYIGRRKSVFKLAKQAILKAGQFAYRDRKVKKRELRASWIVTLNAAVKQFDMNYSIFIRELNKKNIEINRKILADLAQNEPKAFEAVIKQIK